MRERRLAVRTPGDDAAGDAHGVSLIVLVRGMEAQRVGGVAVNIGSRICGLAQPSEILVSQTVKDLVAGSGIALEDGGEHELKGVPDRWRLYRVLRGAR